MLIKYVTTWNELALAYQSTGEHFKESLECFQTALAIYDKITMQGHFQFALGDYLLSKLALTVENISLGELNNKNE
jgi:hypothetical protein